MSISECRLTDNDLDTCSWQLTFEPNDPRIRFGLGYPYLEKLQEAQQSGDECQHVFRLLSAITGLSFGEGAAEPLVPPALLNEVHADDLRVLASRVNDVQDPELRARIRDLSWVVNRDHQAGILAVDDYLQAATQFTERGTWIGFSVLTTRALRLAKSLRNDGAIARVVDRMSSFIREYPITHEARFLARDFIRVLLDARAGDPNDLAGHAHRIAGHADGIGEWDRAQAYWEVEAKCYDRLREAEAARLARIRAAESRVHEARDEAAKGPPFTGAAASKLLEAVKLFQVQGERTRADAIYGEALELQQIARGETGTISMDVDLTRSTDSARGAVRGNELIPALASLANLFQPLNVAWLRAQTEEEIAQYPIQHWIQKTLRDERGRVVARRESRGVGDEDADERALQADMWENAKFYRGGYVAMAIDPGRTLILSEHQPTI